MISFLLYSRWDASMLVSSVTFNYCTREKKKELIISSVFK